jgi:predicted transcriptional regulator of viral defense system
LPGIKNSLKVEDVVTFITEERLYRRLVFKFPSKTEIRYARPSRSTYEVILTLRPNSYFTHLSALFLHGLSDNPDNKIYLNWEQKSKSVLSSELTQDGINNAFARPQRIPKQGKASIDGYDVFILNGKQTEQLGVIQIVNDQLGTVRVTDIERTLIDSTVRPEYAGGVKTVLESYKIAKQRKMISESKIVSYLKSLCFIYPYHQAIGFYMDRCQMYSKKTLKSLLSFPIEFDFYLGYNMKDMEYSPRWRMFFPKDF